MTPDITSALGLSLDNTATYADRGAVLAQTYYKELAPSGLKFAHYFGVTGAGYNSGFNGVGGFYCVAADHPSVTTPGQKPVLYAAAFCVVPLLDRDNAPHDDACCIAVQNDGPGKATELLYFGKGAYNLNRAAIAAIGVECSAHSVMWASGNYDNGIDFSRGLPTPASFVGAAMRVPAGQRAVSARNHLNTADFELLGSDANDRPTLGGLAVVSPRSYTPSVTAASGALTSAAGIGAHSRWSQINGVVNVTQCALVTDKGSGAGDLLIGLPKAAAYRAEFHGHDLAHGYELYGEVLPGESVVHVRWFNGSSPIESGNYYMMAGSYEPTTD